MVSEVGDLILGQEIAAPSVRDSKWPNWKRAQAQSQITAVQTYVIFI